MTFEEAKGFIEEIHPRKLFLSKQEFCTLLSISSTTLERRLKNDADLRKIARKGQKKVLFAVTDIARYVTSC